METEPESAAASDAQPRAVAAATDTVVDAQPVAVSNAVSVAVAVSGNEEADRDRSQGLQSRTPIGSPLNDLLATAKRKDLIEVVKLFQKTEMKGTRGLWRQFLISYDNKQGAGVKDPARRSRKDLIAFLKTFEGEAKLKFLTRVFQSCSERDQARRLEFRAQRLKKLLDSMPHEQESLQWPHEFCNDNTREIVHNERSEVPLSEERLSKKQKTGESIDNGTVASSEHAQVMEQPERKDGDEPFLITKFRSILRQHAAAFQAM